MIDHLTKELKSHLLEYLLLITASVFFLIFISLFAGSHQKQFIILIIFAAYYVIWGAVHHAKEQTLSLKIMLEYLAVGGIALTVLYSILIS